jgi:hypothetical protein
MTANLLSNRQSIQIIDTNNQHLHTSIKILTIQVIWNQDRMEEGSEFLTQIQTSETTHKTLITD